MALTTANVPNGSDQGQQTLFNELWALQSSILDGKRQQYALSTTSIEQLKKAVAAHVDSAEAYGHTVRDDNLDESQRKRRRIEKDLQDQAGKRKVERASTSKLLDVDNVLQQAHSLIPPVSGLKILDDKSSFDENDYYSSQVESEWSPETTKRKQFTADFERFDVESKAQVGSAGADELEDDYEPEEPDDNAEQTTPQDEVASEYEPGEVSQDDEYTPDYALPPAADSPKVHVQNQLTHLAAPQPNYVSPLTVNKDYDIELINGRPEVVKKPRYETDARQSSASPPAKGRKKAKKRKREVEQQPKSKKRDKRMGLDTSAQYPAVGRRSGLDTSAQYTMVKDESYSPQTYQRPQREDLRRVASLQAHNQFLDQRSFSPAIMAPPVYRQEPPPEEIYMPVAPRRVVVDQFGNRYYTADEPVQQVQPVPPPLPDRAPSRVSQYDPTNARIEYLQPGYRPAQTPAYGQDIQMPRIRAQPQPSAQPQYEQVYATQTMPPPAPFYLDRQPPRYAAAPPDFMPQEFAPRQGSVAPVQYHIRQAAPLLRPMSVMPDPGQYRSLSMMPDMQTVPPQPYMVQSNPQIQYVDVRGHELQPRQIPEYRPY